MLGVLPTGGKKLLRKDLSNVKLVCDGNSIMAGTYATSSADDIPHTALSTVPLNSTSIPLSNLGIGGQSLDDMISSAGDVNSAFVAGKTNLLCLFEGTNQIINVGSTGLVAASKMTDYITARKAVHPEWKVIIMTCTPANRTGTGSRSVAQVNAEIDAYNTYIRANYRAMGAVAICEVRPYGGPYSISSYTQADFDGIQTYFAAHEASGNTELHPSDLGYHWLGQQLAKTIASLRL